MGLQEAPGLNPNGDKKNDKREKVLTYQKKKVLGVVEEELLNFWVDSWVTCL